MTRTTKFARLTSPRSWQPWSATCLVALVASMAIASGCPNQADQTGTGEEHDHEHEEMPETYDEAMASIKEHAEEIRAAFDAGTPEEAHDAVHHVGDIINELPALGEKEGRNRAAVDETAEQLFNQFGQLDSKLHPTGDAGAAAGAGAEEENAYNEVADQIDSLILLLETAGKEDAPGITPGSGVAPGVDTGAAAAAGVGAGTEGEE